MKTYLFKVHFRSKSFTVFVAGLDQHDAYNKAVARYQLNEEFLAVTIC
jgi:hypothetical protein